MVGKERLLANFADIEMDVESRGGHEMPIFKFAAVMAAIACGILLIAIYKLLIVVVAGIGFGAAYLVERSQAKRQSAEHDFGEQLEFEQLGVRSI